MPTTTVKTIGSSGADYSTLQAWEDAKPANLTTSIAGGEIWEGRCQNQLFDGGSSALLTISGSTTSASGYAHLTTATGASFRDNVNVQTNALRYNSANGAAITSSVYNSPVISITEGFARISNLQIRNTNAGTASSAISVAAGNVTINGVIAESAASGPSGGTIAQTANSNFVLTNSLLVMRAASASRVLKGFQTITVVNCTIAVPSTFAAASNGIEIQYATDCVIRNTAVFGVVNVGPTSGVNPVTWVNCYTDESTSLPSGVTTTAYSTSSGAQFENISDGTHDYRIKTGSSLKNAGTTDATYGTPSINNLARPQGAAYDVGAWEFAEAPPPGPTINTQPTNQTAKVGATATYTISATTSGGALSYQWKFNGTNVGTNSSTYARSGVVIGDHGGSVTCVVSDSNGSTTSSAATLTVATTFSGPVPAQSGVTGSSFTLALASYFAGGLTRTYAVQVGSLTGSGLTLNTTTGTISGALGTVGAYTITVRATDSASNFDDTNSFTITISASGTAPTVSTQPSNLTVTAGATASFTCAFNGSPTPTIQWQEFSGVSWSNISGQTSGTLSLGIVGTIDNGRQFRAIGTNASGSATTNTAALTVNAAGGAGTITSQPLKRNNGGLTGTTTLTWVGFRNDITGADVLVLTNVPVNSSSIFTTGANAAFAIGQTYAINWKEIGGQHGFAWATAT